MINIIVGWVNLFFDRKNDLARYRAKKCIICPNSKLGWHEAIIGDTIKDIKGVVCSICNCPLSAKLRSDKSECPLKRW